jgi:hypothetical protein
MNCAIPANPDISGIGVRVAIYAQTFLSFVPAFCAIFDGEVQNDELEEIETQSATMLITAFAILISTILQARTYSLSSFHAYIVLDLTWMNNTSIFIYVLFSVHHEIYREHGNGIEPHSRNQMQRVLLSGLIEESPIRDPESQNHICA